MEKLITIRGNSHMCYRPDTCRITVTLSDNDVEYTGVLEKAATQLTQLKDIVEKAGLERSALKTERLSTVRTYKTNKDRKGNETKVATGYAYSQRSTVEFAIDNDKLNAIVYEITEHLIGEISVRYTLKNIEKAKSELLEAATLDGYMKANIIAKNGGAKLIGLVAANYGVREREFMTRDYDCMPMSSAIVCRNKRYLDYDPDDIECEEEVTLYFGIE